MNWSQRAETVKWNIQPFIGGEYHACESPTFENIDPATETSLCMAPQGHAADIDTAVAVARRRFEDGCWSELPPGRRAEILLRLADLVVIHSEDLGLLDCLEMGKPICAAISDARHFAAAVLRSAAGFADKLQGSVAPQLPRSMAFNVYQPRGVVGAITPWNFPIVSAAIKIGPALAAGNCMVLKPSEIACSSALRLAELAVEAGLPEGVLNVVPGFGRTIGSALAAHTDVDLISFTGSDITGHQVMELCARSNGKPMMMECGGKSPQIVFSDVDDLDAVADAAVESVLWNSGQVCVSHSRLIVHKAIKDVLLHKVLERAGRARPGCPLNESSRFGPLASRQQCRRVKNYVNDGLNAGANAVLHGHIQDSGGCYVSPTIFDNVDATMSVWRDEIFGPVLCVHSFETDGEALSLANDTKYGLAATVWTRDIGRGLHMARAIRSGEVAVRMSGAASPDLSEGLSFEPQKSSGFGSEGGLRGLQSYSTLKLVTLNSA